MFNPLELLEPEEAVGNLWHDWASRLGPREHHEGSAVTLEETRPSIAVLFRALGGASGVEIAEAPATSALHRRSAAETLADARPMESSATFDGEHLRLPGIMDQFPDPRLNKAAYLWLAALCAHTTNVETLPEDPLAADLIRIARLREATSRTLGNCPGLALSHRILRRQVLATRVAQPRGDAELIVEELIRASLGSTRALSRRARELAARSCDDITAPRGYRPPRPVAIWPKLVARRSGNAAAEETPGIAPPGLATTTRKVGKRENRDEANRRDSFIIHRFEAIMSWVESLNLNRSVDDDDDENAQKAAEDQEHITLSRHDRRAATRLRLHLDLAPQDADHEALADTHVYPEWNHRARAYLPGHCRVLESDAPTSAHQEALPDPRLVERVRRQFEGLHPRRIMRARQTDGTELDLEAVVANRVALRATGESSDRLYRDLRVTERDLAVAVLMDCSRSTEAVIGERAIIDTAREALAALTAGIDAAGDRVAVWGFSSLRRDRVFLTRCKDFAAPLSEQVQARIAGLRPGHYTRLGAAIRHVSARLGEERATRKLLLVLTDGKPNDLDHYEGIHGIEDSRMAVREARNAGQAVHSIVVDADGQDWFARIFNRSGFTLLPDPARLTRALPAIYRSLIEET
uniref:nitric oxide reductase activation protein NorD n=1 Tax=Stappia sp. TaxID=1870903 RepID=UPI003BADBAC9